MMLLGAEVTGSMDGGDVSEPFDKDEVFWTRLRFRHLEG